MIGTKVGERPIAEIEHIIKAEGLDLLFMTDDNHLFVNITWADGEAGVLVKCGDPRYWSYASLRHLLDDQPCWNLSCFSIVERTREEEEM